MSAWSFPFIFSERGTGHLLVICKISGEWSQAEWRLLACMQKPFGRSPRTATFQVSVWRPGRSPRGVWVRILGIPEITFRIDGRHDRFQAGAHDWSPKKCNIRRQRMAQFLSVSAYMALGRRRFKNINFQKFNFLKVLHRNVSETPQNEFWMSFGAPKRTRNHENPFFPPKITVFYSNQLFKRLLGRARSWSQCFSFQ